MECYMDDANAAPVKEHAELRRLRACGQDFRVTWKRNAGFMQALFVQGSGDDGVRPASNRFLDGAAKKVVSRLAGRSTDSTNLDRAQILRGSLENGNDCLGGLRRLERINAFRL